MKKGINIAIVIAVIVGLSVFWSQRHRLPFSFGGVRPWLIINAQLPAGMTELVVEAGYYSFDCKGPAILFDKLVKRRKAYKKIYPADAEGKVTVKIHSFDKSLCRWHLDTAGISAQYHELPNYVLNSTLLTDDQKEKLKEAHNNTEEKISSGFVNFKPAPGYGRNIKEEEMLRGNKINLVYYGLPFIGRNISSYTSKNVLYHTDSIGFSVHEKPVLKPVKAYYAETNEGTIEIDFRMDVNETDLVYQIRNNTKKITKRYYTDGRVDIDDWGAKAKEIEKKHRESRERGAKDWREFKEREQKEKQEREKREQETQQLKE